MNGHVSPHSLEAERALLGGVLEEPEQISRFSGLREEHFYRPDHGRLWRILQRMTADKRPIDFITLPGYLEQIGQTERCGGIAYIVELPDYTPATANLAHYRDVIFEEKAGRLRQQAGDILFRNPQDADALKHSLALLAEAAALGASGSGLVDGATIMGETLDLMQQEEEQAKAGQLGIPTGLKALDEKIGTLRPGEATILAARPAMGKTALMLNFLRGCIGMAPYVENPVEHRCAVFSLEMKATSLAKRLLCEGGQVDNKRIRSGTMNGDDWGRVLASAADYSARGDRWMVDDTAGLRIGDITARIEEQHAKDPFGVVIVDYLTLIELEGKKGDSRSAAVGAICKTLRDLAKRLQFHLVLLAQLNRAVEQRGVKVPMMSDLRDSGEIEQTADTIVFIYRECVYSEDADPYAAELHIGKARNGTLGVVECRFEGRHQGFYDMAGAGHAPSGDMANPLTG